MSLVLYPPARPQSIGEVIDTAFRIFKATLLRSLPYSVLATVAGFLAAAALGVGWILRPRRTRTEALPTQLELALQAVEAAAHNGDPFTRRTALDALARALDQGEDGAGATAARRLAWKAEVPLPAAMHALVATVRDELRESA